MSRHGRAIRFIETYCAAPKGEGFGRPMRLARFQKEWLEATLADRMNVSILTTPRGNGKSSFGGAVGVWAVFDDEETGAPQVPVIATTIGQAIRSCYGVAASMVHAHPDLEDRALIYTGITTPRIYVPFNEGELFPISNAPDGLQGLDPSFALVDEIGFQPVTSWDALRLAQGKRSRSVVTGVGTPGLNHENALYLIRSLVHEGADLPGVHFTEYAAPDSADIGSRATWRQANPAIRAGFLREQVLETDYALARKGGVAEANFRIFRLGQWVFGVDSWLGPDGPALWEGQAVTPGFTDGAPTWIGVDIALKQDTSAVVVMQRRADGRYHAEARIWRPTADRPVDVTDVMGFLRDQHSRFRVEGISFDPRFFDVPAKMLADEGLPMNEQPQTVERMTAAYVSLYAAIRDRRITHDGNDAFATHVLNGVARLTERGFMLEKGKSRGKIDAAVALALAYDLALRFEPEVSVYAERGALEF